MRGRLGVDNKGRTEGQRLAASTLSIYLQHVSVHSSSIIQPRAPSALPLCDVRIRQLRLRRLAQPDYDCFSRRGHPKLVSPPSLQLTFNLITNCSAGKALQTWCERATVRFVRPSHSRFADADPPLSPTGQAGEPNTGSRDDEELEANIGRAREGRARVCAAAGESTLPRHGPVSMLSLSARCESG